MAETGRKPAEALLWDGPSRMFHWQMGLPEWLTRGWCWLEVAGKGNFWRKAIGLHGVGNWGQ